MDPNTKLYVTNKGALLMRGGVLKTPGSVLLASDFKGIEANLQTLLAAGNLALAPVAAGNGLDVIRGEQLPPMPVAKPGESIDANRMPRLVAGEDGATLAKLAEIKAAAEAKAKAEGERQAALAEVEGESLTVEEAQALGLVE